MTCIRVIQRLLEEISQRALKRSHHHRRNIGEVQLHMDLANETKQFALTTIKSGQFRKVLEKKILITSQISLSSGFGKSQAIKELKSQKNSEILELI